MSTAATYSLLLLLNSMSTTESQTTTDDPSQSPTQRPTYLSNPSTGLAIGADGFETDPCLRITDFAIDGDWWATEAGEVDWSSVLEGTRNTQNNAEFQSDQNQCSNTANLRWGWYYTAGIFCDTFDNDEASHFQEGTKHDLSAKPETWVPLIFTSMQDKGDLTNAYYVGSAWDLIICAAFERINVRGASYMDMEFNQRVVDDYTKVDNEWRKVDQVSELLCHEANVNYTDSQGDVFSWPKDTTWKCRYVNRTSTDIQISFQIANAITDSIIVVSSWDPVALEYKPIRTEVMKETGDPHYYLSSDGAFEAAVNELAVKASSFGYICDDKNPETTWTGGCPNIRADGAFFEACIDFKKLGFTSLDFRSLIIKSRSVKTGSYKDTSGVIYHTICGPEDCVVSGVNKHHPWNFPRSDYGCGGGVNHTAFPTRNPTQPTAHPTTYQPTAETSEPTPYPTEVTTAPSESPTTTEPPTRAPSTPTETPTGNTVAPTRSTGTPTTDTGAPTPGPTVPLGQPSKAPTKKPSKAPTQKPTVPLGSPSRAPTPAPTENPTPEPTAVPSVSPTSERGCDNDNNPLRTDCPNSPGSGCFAQFNFTVNVCLLNKKFGRDTIYETFKTSLIQLYERNPLLIGVCTEDDLAVEEYDITYLSTGSETWAETTDCTGCTVDTYAYQIWAVIGMYCSNNCAKLKSLVETDYADDLQVQDNGFAQKLKENANSGDSVCGTGFGMVEIVGSCGIYRLESRAEGGTLYGTATVCEGSAGDDDDGDDGEDDIATGYNTFYVFVVVVVSFLKLLS